MNNREKLIDFGNEFFKDALTEEDLQEALDSGKISFHEEDLNHIEDCGLDEDE